MGRTLDYVVFAPLALAVLTACASGADGTQQPLEPHMDASAPAHDSGAPREDSGSLADASVPPPEPDAQSADAEPDPSDAAHVEDATPEAGSADADTLDAQPEGTGLVVRVRFPRTE